MWIIRVYETYCRGGLERREEGLNIKYKKQERRKARTKRLTLVTFITQCRLLALGHTIYIAKAEIIRLHESGQDCGRSGFEASGP